jgi:hypothetical protein
MRGAYRCSESNAAPLLVGVAGPRAFRGRETLSAPPVIGLHPQAPVVPPFTASPLVWFECLRSRLRRASVRGCRSRSRPQAAHCGLTSRSSGPAGKRLLGRGRQRGAPLNLHVSCHARMNKEPLRALPRHLLFAMYGLWLSVLVYCIFGAITGELTLPGRNSIVVIRGWAAWLACLVPPLFIVEAFVHFDPNARLRRSMRIALSIVLIAAAGVVIFVVVGLGPQA